MRFVIMVSALVGLISTVLLAQQPIVPTTKGKIEGISQEGVFVFKGVPYAAPPVGALRWREPALLASWEGVKKCNQFPPSPPQSNPVPFMMWTEEFITPPQPLSEDCLYLNIWTKTLDRNARKPVLVWIHGGGFVSGSGACAVYDGTYMAQQDIVYVTINYRLGALGFLSLPQLSQESGRQASGNYAFMDQLAALKWVQQNIAAFGGDPTRVTIAGQSAGSFSVNALVSSPLGKGLFSGAIAQSGGLFTNRVVKPLPDAEKNGTTFLEQAGVKTLAELRAMPVDDLMKVALTMPFGTFGPALDGYVLPSDPVTYFREGMHNDVPLLTGWVTGDGGLMGGQPVTAQSFKEQAEAQYGARSGEFLGVFPANTDQVAATSQVRLSLCQFAAFQSHLWAQFNKSNSYLYEFSFVPTDKPGFPNYGAFHTSEVPYAYHTLNRWNRPWADRDRKMESDMSSYWVNFIKTGNPNGPGLPVWDPHRAEGSVMILGEQCKTTSKYLDREFSFLQTLLK